MSLAVLASLHFLSFFLVSVHSTKHESSPPICPPFICGDISIEFPFNTFHNPKCGLFLIDCVDSIAKIGFEGGRVYDIKNISYSNSSMVVQDTNLTWCLENGMCDPISKLPIQTFGTFYSKTPLQVLTLYICKSNYHFDLHGDFNKYSSCKDSELYFSSPWDNEIPGNQVSEGNCSSGSYLVPLMVKGSQWGNFNLLSSVRLGIHLQWDIRDCINCMKRGGRCGPGLAGNFSCYCSNDRHGKPCSIYDQEGSKTRVKFIAGISAAAGALFLAGIAGFIFFYICRRSEKQAVYLDRSISYKPATKPDYGKGSTTQSLANMPAVSLFTYQELEQATNNFNPSNELGDGGFGTVYYGKLRDGRSVAVKRLYESNYKRVEQFMNEVKILSGLRHQNLVCLYGCTSRHSRELLLVYEYISNGTVADHLHSDPSKVKAGLCWSTRLKIAVETAEALAFLHAVEPPIIHRDVKTNNILLDSSYRVKVADFGLSRLFPMDATHVSTAPQGTPGYVDPDYHQSYQLTDKSDVYSFGVVLFELISSKLAVDISRDRDEINLANLAVHKIIHQALNELVDPSIGFESDPRVRRMVTGVADLAFRCLAAEKDERPPMEEVLEVLKGIEKDGLEDNIPREDADILTDEVGSSKTRMQVSPDSVTNKCSSKSTSPNHTIDEV